MVVAAVVKGRVVLVPVVCLWWAVLMALLRLKVMYDYF